MKKNPEDGMMFPDKQLSLGELSWRLENMPVAYF